MNNQSSTHLNKFHLENDRIAILLGVYNAEKYLNQQLDSIINQTYKNWTLFIRDDNSMDNCKEIILQYALNNDNIIIIEDKLGNLGCNGNYFRLLDLVDAKYYMFCNADDYWMENKIEVTIQKMNEIETLYKDYPIIIHTDLCITDKDLNVLEDSMWNLNNVNPSFLNKYNYLGVCCTVSGATMLFNKQVKDITFPVHKDAPFFDHWIALQVAKNRGKIIPIEKATIYYRQVGTNLAAVVMGNKRKLTYKIRHIKQIYNINKKEAIRLKRIGWGGYIKYIVYKIKVLCLIRGKKMY